MTDPPDEPGDELPPLRPTGGDQWSLRSMFLAVVWCCIWFAVIRAAGPFYYYTLAMAFVGVSLMLIQMRMQKWSVLGIALVLLPPAVLMFGVVAAVAPRVSHQTTMVVAAGLAFGASLIASGLAGRIGPNGAPPTSPAAPPRIVDEAARLGESTSCGSRLPEQR